MSVKNPEVISHWYMLMENFETSGMEFYQAVEAALQERGVPDITTSRVEWQEGGLATARREYLRIQRSRLAFDICAAPFGKGFFFSWWLARIPQQYGIVLLGAISFGLLILYSILWQALGFFLATLAMPVLLGVLGLLIRDGKIQAEEAILEVPIIGSLYERIFSPSTYYRLDTALMFQESVRNAVMEVVGELRNEKGLRALSEAESRPHVRELAGAR